MEEAVGFGGVPVGIGLSPAQVAELYGAPSWHTLADPELVAAFMSYCVAKATAEHDGTITFEVDGPSVEPRSDEYFEAFKSDSWSDEHWETLLESGFKTALFHCDPPGMAQLSDCADPLDIVSDNVYETFRAYCELDVFRKFKAIGQQLSGKRSRSGELSMEADQMLQEQGFEVFEEFKLMMESHRTGMERNAFDDAMRSRNEEPSEAGGKGTDSAWESKRWSRPSSGLDPYEGPDNCERIYSAENVKLLKKHAGRRCGELDKRPELADPFKAFLFYRRIERVKKHLPELVKKYETDDDFRSDITVAEIREEFKNRGAAGEFDKIYLEFVEDFSLPSRFRREEQDAARRRAEEKRGTLVVHAKSGVEYHGASASLHDRRLVLLDKHCDLPAEVIGPLADLTSQDVVLFCDVIKSKGAFDLVNAAASEKVHRKKGVERTTALADLVKSRQRRSAAPVHRNEFSTVLTVLGRNDLLGILTSIGRKGLAEKDRKNLPRALSGKW